MSNKTRMVRIFIYNIAIYVESNAFLCPEQSHRHNQVGIADILSWILSYYMVESRKILTLAPLFKQPSLKPELYNDFIQK